MNSMALMAASSQSSNKCMGQYMNVREVSIQKNDFCYNTIYIDNEILWSQIPKITISYFCHSKKKSFKHVSIRNQQNPQNL